VRKKKRKVKMTRELIDLTGKRFGRLTVIKRSYPNGKNYRVKWLCKCDCGNEKIIASNHLIKNEIKSCGCLRVEKSRNNKHAYLGPGVSNMRSRIYIYKKSAKIRGYDYSLTEKQFVEITQKPCYYCGAPPNNKHKQKETNGSYIYNGIDRVDNTKGYTINNVVPCCKTCNSAKGRLTLQEFKDWIKRAYNKTFKEEEMS